MQLTKLSLNAKLIYCNPLVLFLSKHFYIQMKAKSGKKGTNISQDFHSNSKAALNFSQNNNCSNGDFDLIETITNIRQR